MTSEPRLEQKHHDSVVDFQYVFEVVDVAFVFFCFRRGSDAISRVICFGTMRFFSKIFLLHQRVHLQFF